MGSPDYLNSARRAAIVFFVLAFGALGGAVHERAVSVWGGAPVALGADATLDHLPHGRVGDLRRGERSPPRRSRSVEIG